jgi:hypothetical protein
MTVRQQDVVRQALSRVLDPVLVEHLRGDSPVLSASGAGLTAVDAIAVADAVEQVADEAGAVCVLLDEDLSVHDGPVTFDQLTDSVARRWREVP